MAGKVVVVATGGTIASRYDAQSGSVVAAENGEELVRMVPEVAGVAPVEVENFSRIGSFQLTPEVAYRLVQRIDALCSRPDVAGVVVTHGTDTMEETCYLTSLLVDSEKPVVFTGAQRNADDRDSDGPRNLLDSIRVAASDEARGLGAVICFDQEIHGAREVTKYHSIHVGGFASPGYGMLGEVDRGEVIIYRRPVRRRAFRVDHLEGPVDLIKLVMGSDARYIDTSIASGAVGVVLEAFGRGNGNSAILDGVKRAVSQGIPVVVTSRCPVGRVYPTYGGGGGGKDLWDAGAIFAGDLSGMKARLLLMVLLAHTRDRDRLQELIAEM